MQSDAPLVSDWSPGIRLRASQDGVSVLAGEWACDGMVANPGSDESASHHQVWLQRVGSHTLEMGGCNAVAEPGSAILHRSGDEYRTRSRLGTAQASTILFIRDESLADLMEEVAPWCEGRFPSPVVSLRPAAAVAHYHLRRVLRGGDASPLEVQEVAFGTLREILLASHDLASEPRAAGHARTRRAHRDLVHAAQQLLAEHYSSRLLLEDLGRRLGSSPFHLSRVFARETGIPIHRYLTRIRLYAALEWMGTGEMELSSIAHRVGFSSHSHFTTSFRREFGRPPAHIRGG